MLRTLEGRNGFNLQTGYGHVRVLPFSGDAYVSVKDLLAIQLQRGITLKEIVEICQRNAQARS